ncbi:MAG TPA: VanW family protein, partial [Solirubrobacteraceae bacterium]|nr:VanW family protein [Solirubrobacteraceae bacterium]
MAVLTGRKATQRGFARGLSTRASVPLLVVVLALIAVALVVQFGFESRALPGLRVAGVSVGAHDAGAIRAALAAEASRPWASATTRVVAGERTWSRTNAELGIAPDLDAATAAALAYGKHGSLIDRAGAWLSSLTGSAHVPFVMRAEGTAAEQFVSQVAAEVDRPAVDGEIAVGLTGATLREPAAGRELDRAHALAALLGAQALGDRDVELRVRTRHPALDAAGFAEAAALVRAVTTPLEVSAGDRGVVEDPVALATFLNIERVVAGPGELPAVPGDAIAPSSRYRYVASIAPDRVKAWALAVAAALDRPAKNATYTVGNGGSLVAVPSVTGVKIDVDSFVAQALRELATATSGRRTITPTFVADVPVFTTEQAQQFASQMTRVSVFETFFPPNLARWKNISTGAAQFNNIVIAPGDTFSFWKLIGEVTVQRGYAFAGAIIDGRSDPNVIGGGLCQVSTTIFMAVAQAGYEILERGNHDYYIDRYPLGLDAAVFDPGLDLRWKNDTKYPVLIRSSTSNIAVEFEIFTVPTGRTVTFGPA